LLELSNTAISTLDVSQNPLLEVLLFFNTNVSAIDLSNNSNITNLNIESTPVTAIDLSNLLDLELLRLEECTDLTALDTSNNAALIQVFCGLSGITSLDFSNNPNLTWVDAFASEVTTLNIQNGNNAAITNFIASSNPSLSCIQIDAGFTPPSSWLKDAAATYSDNCSNTDTTNPVAVCQNITIVLNENGVVSITDDQIDGGSTDNVGIETITANKTFYSCEDVGVNSVTLTVTDAAGNSDTCNAFVIVVDDIDPEISCPTSFTVNIDQGDTFEVGNYTMSSA